MISEHAKHAFDGISVTATIAALAGWLPALAAFASLVWTVIRIVETDTVQGWLHRQRTKKVSRRRK